MNVTHVAICEDENVQAQSLQAMVLKWAENADIIVKIRIFESAESFLFEYAQDKSFDILLLDIEMKKMSGVELAKKVREENKEIQLIFVTGYMDYIAEGYDVEALNHLLKPVSQEKFFSVLDRAKERLKEKSHSILLQCGGESVRIPLYEIRYIEVQKNYLTLHARADFTVKKALRELEEELDESFFKTGRSFWVNLRFVKRITKTEVFLKDETAVPLSRGLYDKINQALIRYF